MPSPYHPQIANLLGIITLAIWLHLFFGRAWFWRVRRLDADRNTPKEPAQWPSVSVVVPARNEAETIAQVITSLMLQNYPGDFSITLVDDHSTDATAEIARQAAAQHDAAQRVTILSASDLPSGWTGKLWALNEGVTSAAASSKILTPPPGAGVTRSAAQAPDSYWFTDADIVHAPDTLKNLIARAELSNLDLTSLMVLLQSKTLPERALIPAFLYFFLMLYPPGWIADEDLATAGAAGGCILLKRSALERIGGLASIRGEVIDDCALAKAVKSSGGKVWLGLTRKSTSLRAYGTFSEIRDLIARTAYTQLRYSPLVLAGTLLGMLLTYVAPIALLFAHDSTARALGATAWLLMTLSFLPTVRFYRLSALWAPLLPLTALFYTYATWLSALRYWMGKGGQWKGRAQAQKT
jgi:hopene-associated glycosyltransferase HpnB